MNDAQRHALAVLADCPEGSTRDALITNAGCDADALAWLVKHALARDRTKPMANPAGLMVTRYWITDAGLKFHRSKPCDTA
jgi:hypothetical protein